jgi:hypothetical protein
MEDEVYFSLRKRLSFEQEKKDNERRRSGSPRPGAESGGDEFAEPKEKIRGVSGSALRRGPSGGAGLRPPRKKSSSSGAAPAPHQNSSIAARREKTTTPAGKKTKGTGL